MFQARVGSEVWSPSAALEAKENMLMIQVLHNLRCPQLVQVEMASIKMNILGKNLWKREAFEFIRSEFIRVQ